MKAPGRLPVVFGLIVSVASWFTFVVVASGADPPVEKMLDGLRESHYYDLAVSYLEQMRQRPDCPAEFKDRIDYEIGVTLLEAADATETVSERETTLDQATAAVQKFLQEHPTHEMAGPASTQLGRVLLLRGAVRVQQGELPGVSPDDKNAKFTEARKFFDDAQSALEGAENRCYEKAKSLKDQADADPSDRAQEKLEDAYGELLQARLLLVNIADRRARTYAPDTKEYKEQLEAAAKRYSELFEKNEERIGGLQARNFEGKVYCDLDQNDKALEIFREMLTLPEGSGAIRNLKRQSFLWLMETLLKPNVKKYDEAMEAAAKWKDDAMPNELASPEGLRIQLLAGQACLEAAKALDPKDDKRRTLVRSAREYLEFVQRAPGSTRKDASNLLMDELFGVAEASEAVPKTFDEAFEQANVAWLQMLTTDGQMRQATDPKQQAELSDQVAAARESAARYCRLTLEMANKQTDLVAGQHRSFLPDFSVFHGRSTPRCGRDGRAPRIPVSPKPRCPQGCRDRRQSLPETLRYGTPGGSRYVLRNGPDAASGTVCDHSLAGRSRGRRSMDHALRHRHRPAGYCEGRPSTWRSFRPIRPEEPAPNCDWDRPIGPSMSATHRWKKESGQARRNWTRLAKKAQDTLRQGIDRLSKVVDAGGEIDYPLAYSVLALAQILIDAGNAEEAARWLDDPKIGPMTLIAANNPAVDRTHRFPDRHLQSGASSLRGDREDRTGRNGDGETGGTRRAGR